MQRERESQYFFQSVNNELMYFRRIRDCVNLWPWCILCEREIATVALPQHEMVSRLFPCYLSAVAKTIEFQVSTSYRFGYRNKSISIQFSSRFLNMCLRLGLQDYSQRHTHIPFSSFVKQHRNGRVFLWLSMHSTLITSHTMALYVAEPSGTHRHPISETNLLRRMNSPFSIRSEIVKGIDAGWCSETWTFHGNVRHALLCH